MQDVLTALRARAAAAGARVRVEESLIRSRHPAPGCGTLVADPRRLRRACWSWFTAFDARGPWAPARARGARYRVRVRAGSAEVGGLVEITEYDEGARRRVDGGPRDRAARRACACATRPAGAPGCSCASPTAPRARSLGTLSELVAEPQVRGEVRASLASLARAATGQERPAPRRPALPARLAHEAVNVGLLARAGLVAPMRPDRIARLALAAARWGASPATAIVAGAIRHPGRTLLADEEGELTYGEVDRRTSAVARGLAAQAGVGPGDRVGILCRDGRAFVEALLGVAKLGADAVLLNPSFAAPQITDVCRRERHRRARRRRGPPRPHPWRRPGAGARAGMAGTGEPPARCGAGRAGRR